MSLRRKMLFKDAILLAGLVLLITGSVLGFWRQRRHVQASLNEYSALHHVEIAQTKLVAFEQSVHDGAMNQPSANAELRASLSAMSEYKAIVSQYDNILPSEITPELQETAKTKTRSIVTKLAELVRAMEPSQSRDSVAATPASHSIEDQESGDAGVAATEQWERAAHPEGAAPADPAVVCASVDNVLRQMADLLLTCNDFVHRTELESDRDLRAATIGVAAIACCMLVIAIAASSWQYRKVVVPLQRLRQWCRLAASGNFSVKYEPTNEIEFQELGQDVNKMGRPVGRVLSQARSDGLAEEPGTGAVRAVGQRRLPCRGGCP